MAIIRPYVALEGRDVPKLNGSSGAFIAVVVVLVLIIVVACTAVAYLIYESRQEGRQPQRQYQASRTLDLENVQGDSSSSGGIFHRLLSKHKKKTSTTVADSKISMTGQGWVQAARDECDDEESTAKRRFRHATQMSEILDASRPPSAIPSANTSPASVQRPLPISTDSRPRVPSMLSDRSMSGGSYQGTSLRYHEPFAPVPQRSISTFTTHLAPSMFSSPASSPPPSVNRPLNGSPEPLSGDESLQVERSSVYMNGKGRPFATRSGTSMLTFEGGTKFVEEL